MEYFITGIDTNIGKTFITKGLALHFEKEGKTIGVYKPLQSGAIEKDNILIAPDIEEIKKLSNNINTKCSYILKGDVSPALAARLSNIEIDIKKIKEDFDFFKNKNEITLVEGAGGILAPVTDKLLCADLIKELDIPVIIVTVPFLGRLNHTLLTIHYAQTKGIKIKGIIINRIPKNTNDLASKNFINELKMYTNVDILGYVNETTDENIANEFSQINIH